MPRVAIFLTYEGQYHSHRHFPRRIFRFCSKGVNWTRVVPVSWVLVKRPTISVIAKDSRRDVEPAQRFLTSSYQIISPVALWCESYMSGIISDPTVADVFIAFLYGIHPFMARIEIHKTRWLICNMQKKTYSGGSRKATIRIISVRKWDLIWALYVVKLEDSAVIVGSNIA